MAFITLKNYPVLAYEGKKASSYAGRKLLA
jgi:hypothetical protein